jgi:hypothetical protein
MAAILHHRFADNVVRFDCFAGRRAPASGGPLVCMWSLGPDGALACRWTPAPTVRPEAAGARLRRVAMVRAPQQTR